MKTKLCNRIQQLQPLDFYLMIVTLLGLYLIGPRSVFAQQTQQRWLSLGPYYSKVYSIAQHPQESNILFAATERGLYKTENGGMSWLLLDNGLPRYHDKTGKETTAIAFGPDQSFYVGITKHGIYKSMDYGNSWQDINAGVIDQIKPTITQILTDKSNSKVIYIVTDDQLYKTMNGGQSWRNILDSQHLFKVALTSTPDILYAQIRTSIGKSIDGGLNWVWQERPTGRLLSVHKDVVFIQKGSGKIMKSTNGGTDWTIISDSELENISVFRWQPRTSDILIGNVKSFKEKGKISKGAQFMKSSNGGKSWEALGTIPFRLNDFIWDITNKDVLYAATADGVWKSIDGGYYWRKTSIGLPPSSEVTTIAIDPVEANTVYARFPYSLFRKIEGLYKTNDGGITWEKIKSEQYIGSPLVIDPLNNKIFYSASRSSLLKSPDGGKTWITTPVDVEISDIVINPKNPDELYLIGGKNLVKTLDAGFSVFSSGSPASGYKISFLEIVPSNPSKIYVIASAPYKHKVLRSTDSGKSFEELLNVSVQRRVSGWRYSAISAIEVDPTNTNSLFLGTGDGLITSKDKGRTWVTVEKTKLLKASVHSILYTGKNIIVGTNRGVAISYDSGNTWNDFTLGLVGKRVSDVGYHAPTSDVYVTTKDGIYRLAKSPEPEWLITRWKQLESHESLKSNAASINVSRKSAQEEVASDVPVPIGGLSAIQRALKYPERARKAGIEGRVIVQILVSEKGKIIDTKILKSLGHTGCDDAAIDAIKSVKWKPAWVENKPVRAWVAVPVVFKL